MPEEDSGDNEKEDEANEPATKRAKAAQKDEPQRTWKKEDISYPPLPDFTHSAPDAIRSPFEYFQDMFPMTLVEDIVHQTNLYARLKNINTPFQMEEHELMVFIGIVLYMGVCTLPSIEDYWGTLTRVTQVADAMSSKRFRLIRSILHFNNNENIHGTADRFFKVRPLYDSLTRQFLKVKETPTHSIDEVMVAYKGTRAGTLRRSIPTGQDKCGFKLFCRASSDGFIHDILMYQGETTFTSHHTMLSQGESQMPFSTKTVLALAKTINRPDPTIYADNFFTSIELVEYLKDNLGCRYVGTARDNRVGHAPLISPKELDKKTTPRGKYDYCSSNGILALRWKDNKNVTVLSSDVGVKPVGKVKRYDRYSKKKVEVPCPNVVKQYNKMGGINKSDMLTHLYKSPMRARRWYMRLFGYALDLSVCNAWILYKRDCRALGKSPIFLKFFRLDISRFALSHKTMGSSRRTRASSNQPMTIPRRGQFAELPSDRPSHSSKPHLPIFVRRRLTCKHCSTKATLHRTRWMCDVCQIALCLSDNRNCFRLFHTPPAELSDRSISEL
ncbi:UNVERIFIED_CONTAM: hypothetical protein GTU68_017636 [Idotea baltica]|nr:hypothetical protein [Idotea baltica]